MNRIDCQEALAHLQDYLKRELTPDLLVEVKAHLSRCRDCEGYACFEQSFLQLLQRRAGKECCPQEVRARIVAALRAEARNS
jgi:anti-sigma factor (TIGR02949 family)